MPCICTCVLVVDTSDTRDTFMGNTPPFDAVYRISVVSIAQHDTGIGRLGPFAMFCYLVSFLVGSQLHFDKIRKGLPQPPNAVCRLSVSSIGTTIHKLLGLNVGHSFAMVKGLKSGG